MEESKSTIAERIAQAAVLFQAERTGHAPSSATAVLSGDTLVITLYDALSEAERVMALSPEGAAKVREFHRELFRASALSLRQEIQKITGVAVRESASVVESAPGGLTHAFANGTMVQVFQFAQVIPQATWNGSCTKGTGDGLATAPTSSKDGADACARRTVNIQGS